jgi:hypothetical protein
VFCSPNKLNRLSLGLFFIAKTLGNFACNLHSPNCSGMCPAADGRSALKIQPLVVLQVSEAEAMVPGGVSNVLVSNEVVSPRKLQRLVALAAQGEATWLSLCLRSTAVLCAHHGTACTTA